MTLESICLEIEAEYGPFTSEFNVSGTVAYLRGSNEMTNLSFTWEAIQTELMNRYNSSMDTATIAISEISNDKFVTEEISPPEKPMPILSLIDNFATSLDIAVSGTSANDKVVTEGAKVHGFLCVLNANFVIEYHTTASSVADKIGICRRTKVPKLKVGDKIGNIEILYINHK